MKILIYSHAFAPMVGGVETVVMLLAKRLAQHSCLQVTLVTPTPGNGMNDSTLPFKIVRQPTLAGLFRSLLQADLVHLAGPVLTPMIIGILLHKPIVIEHHGFQSACPNGQFLYQPMQKLCPGHFMARRYRECIRCNGGQGKLQSLKMWLLTFPRRWLCQCASTNILPTDWLGTVLQLNRSITIRHGLPPVEPKPDSNITPTVPTFVFLGRLVSTKGAHVLLRAAQQLKTKGLAFQVKIIGQGPDRQVLEQLANDLQILNCVQFLGHIPTDKLDQDLTGVTAVVIPSLAGEVFGLVAAENMERGRLVIVSDSGALAEVVGDAGLRFAPGDASDLARCMEAAIADPALAVSLGSRASQRIAQFFSADRMEQEHLQAYEELYSHRLA